MIGSVEGQIRDLTWREAAGAGVGDLEHVCPRKPETICIAHKDQVHGNAMCPAALQQPLPPASATGSCQQQLLHSGTALQQLLPEMCTEQQQSRHRSNCGTLQISSNDGQPMS
jgi:hypothetical protein